MELEQIDINELKAYQNNAKKHPKEQIQQIKQSIESFGFNDPIAIDESNMIIEGHGRMMASAYDDCVKKGYHPGRGNKTAEQAVIAHELGHSLTSVAMQKMRSNNFDDVSKKIMKEAQNILSKGLKKKKYPGTRKIATKISEYATSSNAECIAEATADVYCNGSKAKAESKAVVQALKGFMK